MTGAPIELVSERVIAASNELPPPQNLRYVVSRIHTSLARSSALQSEMGKLRKCSIVKQLDTSRIEIQTNHGVKVVVSINEGYPDSPTGISVETILGSSIPNVDTLVKSLNSRCISSIDQAYQAVKTALTVVEGADLHS